MPIANVNRKKVTVKSGVTIAFPDVCKVPTPPAPIPIPYPSVATIARASQTAKKAGGSKGSTWSSGTSMSQGAGAGAMKGIVSSRTMGRTTVKMAAPKVKAEGAALKSMLTSLNNKVASMDSPDANEWQDVVTKWLVAAAALYETVNSEE